MLDFHNTWRLIHTDGSRNESKRSFLLRTWGLHLEVTHTYVMMKCSDGIGVCESFHFIVFLRVYNEMETYPRGSHFIVFLMVFNEMEQHRWGFHFIVSLRVFNEMKHCPFHRFTNGFQWNFICQLHHSVHISRREGSAGWTFWQQILICVWVYPALLQ